MPKERVKPCSQTDHLASLVCPSNEFLHQHAVSGHSGIVTCKTTSQLPDFNGNMHANLCWFLGTSVQRICRRNWHSCLPNNPSQLHICEIIVVKAGYALCLQPFARSGIIISSLYSLVVANACTLPLDTGHFNFSCKGERSRNHFCARARERDIIIRFYISAAQVSRSRQALTWCKQVALKAVERSGDSFKLLHSLNSTSEVAKDVLTS